MNELKGFEPGAWVPKFSWQRSIDATACKSKRSFDDIPLYTADQLAAVVQQRDELLLAATNLIRVRGRHHTEQAYKQLEAAIKKVQP